MHRPRGASGSITSDKIFSGVRFVLFGFDSVSEARCRSELVRGGGVDVGQYDQSCTHVIVCRRVFDDPVCATAREDGKILVNELWVDDSLEHRTMADASRILYTPVKDLNGIPGVPKAWLSWLACGRLVEMGKGRILAKPGKMPSHMLTNFSFLIYLSTNGCGTSRVGPLG